MPTCLCTYYMHAVFVYFNAVNILICDQWYFPTPIETHSLGSESTKSVISNLVDKAVD